MSSRDHEASSAGADLLVGAFLFLATGAFVLWQNAHLTVLWDLSYILENATRISLGQVPYRDFPFPYAPLTFLVQAVIIQFFGRAVVHHYLYAAFAGACTTLLTWRILLRLLGYSRLPARLVAFLLAVPLIFLGTNSVLPIPFYDSDCTLFILLCIWLLLRLEAARYPSMGTFVCGILLAVPAFIKQNTGLAFLLSVVVTVGYLGVRNREMRRPGVLLIAGAGCGFAWALAVIQLTAGLGNYFRWTVKFAASRRLPGLSTMLGVYRDLELIWIFCVFALGLALWFWRRSGAHRAVRWLAVALLSLPFFWAVVALKVNEDASDRVEALLHLWPVLLMASLGFALWGLVRAKELPQLLRLILLGVIHGAFLSQQLWGSTYALWPLLLILMATVLMGLAPQTATDLQRSTAPVVVFSVVISLTLLIAGGYYALSHERLQYVDLSGDTLEHSNLGPLRGVAMRGDWLADFEELVSYTDQEIPREDAILMLPGEDLFYFTTGRTPRFPVVMLDNTVNPYTAAEIAELARERNVRWLVVKRRLQLQEEPMAFRTELLELLGRDFEAVESLNNYEIYRRKAE
jgi:4-amino-4-deoxy-L-arabinose transferase-like glycosyltransferase